MNRFTLLSVLLFNFSAMIQGDPSTAKNRSIEEKSKTITRAFLGISILDFSDQPKASAAIKSHGVFIGYVLFQVTFLSLRYCPRVVREFV